MPGKSVVAEKKRYATTGQDTVGDNFLCFTFIVLYYCAPVASHHDRLGSGCSQCRRGVRPVAVARALRSTNDELLLIELLDLHQFLYGNRVIGGKQDPSRSHLRTRPADE